MSPSRMQRFLPIPTLTGDQVTSLLSRLLFFATGCWRWTGAQCRGGMRTRPRANTYGHLYLQGRNYKVHRILWSLFRARELRVPEELDELVLDHKDPANGRGQGCPTWCVNPWHLEPVSNEENVARANRERARRRRAA